MLVGRFAMYWRKERGKSIGKASSWLFGQHTSTGSTLGTAFLLIFSDTLVPFNTDMRLYTLSHKLYTSQFVGIVYTFIFACLCIIHIHIFVTYIYSQGPTSRSTFSSCHPLPPCPSCPSFWDSWYRPGFGELHAFSSCSEWELPRDSRARPLRVWLPGSSTYVSV